MEELNKVLNNLKRKQNLFNEIYRKELEREKHIKELFPAYAIQDEAVISKIADEKAIEKINEEILAAIEKDLGDILG